MAALDFQSSHAVEKSQWRWTADEFLPTNIPSMGECSRENVLVCPFYAFIAKVTAEAEVWPS